MPGTIPVTLSNSTLTLTGLLTQLKPVPFILPSVSVKGLVRVSHRTGKPKGTKCPFLSLSMSLSDCSLCMYRMQVCPFNTHNAQIMAHKDQTDRSLDHVTRGLGICMLTGPLSSCPFNFHLVSNGLIEMNASKEIFPKNHISWILVDVTSAIKIPYKFKE